MSYDIDIEYEVETAPEVRRLKVPTDWNYTSNCARMWRAAGADLAEFHGKKCGECASILESAIAAMKHDPDTYRAMDPPNRWGSYDTVLPRLEELLDTLKQWPNGTIRVCR